MWKQDTGDIKDFTAMASNLKYEVQNTFKTLILNLIDYITPYIQIQNLNIPIQQN